MGELPDEGIYLVERQRGERMPLELAPHEAVVGDGQVARKLSEIVWRTTARGI